MAKNYPCHVALGAERKTKYEETWGQDDMSKEVEPHRRETKPDLTKKAARHDLDHYGTIRNS